MELVRRPEPTQKLGASALSRPKPNMKRAVKVKPRRRPCASATMPHALAPTMVPRNTALDSSDSWEGDSPHSQRTCSALELKSGGFGG